MFPSFFLMGFSVAKVHWRGWMREKKDERSFINKGGSNDCY